MQPLSIDLSSDRNLYFLKGVSCQALSKLYDIVEKMDVHRSVIFASSGTTHARNTHGGHKVLIHKKQSLIINARAVIERLGLSSQDIWGLTLPTYHIAGISILVRAQLVGSKVINLRPWDCESVVRKIDQCKVRIVSFVPTQIYDIVSMNLPAPKHLRYVLVGGDFLSTDLETRAKKLGWPLVLTYGMSECGPQLCCGRSDRLGYLKLLPIFQVKTDSQKKLCIKGESLFCDMLTFSPLTQQWTHVGKDDLCDEHGYFISSDFADVDFNESTQVLVKPLGRYGEVKIAGHLVDYHTLRNKVENTLLSYSLQGECFLSVEADDRLGARLVLYVTYKFSGEIVDEIVEILKPATLEHIFTVDKMDTTALGKVKLPRRQTHLKGNIG